MPYLASIYQCTLAKLRATDIDQEVKERAITCMYVYLIFISICDGPD